MRSLGLAGTLLNRLDVALETGARHQRDVAAGQGTLFDLFAEPEPVATPSLADGGEPAPSVQEDDIPRRERLRWEKELLGLYLSEHPLGEIADQLPEYVTAYTGDLAEEQDQARVTLGGILQGVRRVITRAGATMLVANLEDLTGTVEVVVFPKVLAETANAWAEDAVVLVSGRIDHRDEEAKLLCEAVHAWDDAVRMGPTAFSAERDRLLRGRSRGPTRPNGNGGGGGWSGSVAIPVSEAATGVMPTTTPAGATVGTAFAEAPVRVSPIKQDVRAEAVVAAPPLAPASMASPALSAAPELPVEPADEAPAPADAVPLQAAPAADAPTLEVAFDPSAPMDRLLPAIESVTRFLGGHPGPLAVLIEVPVAGATRQVRLRERVAWDDRVADGLRRAADLPLTVELRARTGQA
jgi:hypothetical protein